MEFDSNKPIYIQIADSFSDRILSGDLKAGDRILSVRELGSELGVNPNTIMRAYEILTEQNVIFNKRGIGYFVSESASDIVLETERRKFIESEFPKTLKRAELLGIDIKELL